MEALGLDSAVGALHSGMNYILRSQSCVAIYAIYISSFILIMPLSFRLKV
jgi:hypothetical protein